MSDIHLLQPGEDIRPVLTLDEGKLLLQKLYGMECISITKLNGYDDKNYKVVVTSEFDNPFVRTVCEKGYVLKVLNSLDSKKTDFVDAQNELMLFVENNGIKCPIPVQNKSGNYYSVETLSSGKHVVRLLLYQPGSILHQISVPESLYEQLGDIVARFDLIVKNFNHTAYSTHKTLWMLEAVPQLREFIFAITDTVKRRLIETIIQQFEDRVLKNISKFEKGLIHGDFNEQNIVVDRKKNDEWEISSILDFGDTHYSCIMFDLAVAIAYMLILEQDIRIGGLVITGYSKVRNIPEIEMSVLKVCVAARICQSLVLGAYSSLQDPDNKYITTTQKTGWTILQKLWIEPEEELLKKWKNATSIKN